MTIFSLSAIIFVCTTIIILHEVVVFWEQVIEDNPLE